MKVKSFAVPRLEPGTIIEYKLKQYTDYIYSFPAYIEEQWPTKRFFLHIKPYQGLGSIISTYNGAGGLSKHNHEYFLESKYLSGIREEPFMAPRTAYEPWLYFRYTDNAKEDRGQFWRKRCKYLIKDTKSDIAYRHKAIKAKAKELFSGTHDSMEKLRRAYDFCSRDIVNVYGPYSSFTHGELSEMELNDSAVDTLKNGYGTGSGIDNLFASLVKAGGFEVRIGLAENKTQLRFDPALMTYNNLVDPVVVVKDEKGYDWKAFNPGALYLPFGYLNSKNANATFLVPDTKSPQFFESETLDVDESVIERNADFELDDAGNIEGVVTITYRGYPEIWRKRKYDSYTQESAQEAFLESWKQRMPSAEFTDFEMQNQSSFTEPLIVRFRVSYSNFGESLGSRIFLEPFFFQKGVSDPFDKENRISDICFAFPYSIKDTLSYTLPEGYELAEISSPDEASDNGSFKYSSSISKGQEPGKVLLRREFVVMEDQLDKDLYQSVKRVYSGISWQDARSITVLKVD